MSLSFKSEFALFKKNLTALAHEIFQLSTNLLCEKVCQPWDVIVKGKMESSLYTGIFRVKQKKSR